MDGPKGLSINVDSFFNPYILRYWVVGVSDFQSKIIIDDRSVVRFVRLTKVIINIVNDCNIFSVVVNPRRRKLHAVYITIDGCHYV